MTGTEGQTLTATGAAIYSEEVCNSSIKCSRHSASTANFLVTCSHRKREIEGRTRADSSVLVSRTPQLTSSRNVIRGSLAQLCDCRKSHPEHSSSGDHYSSIVRETGHDEGRYSGHVQILRCRCHPRLSAQKRTLQVTHSLGHSAGPTRKSK